MTNLINKIKFTPIIVLLYFYSTNSNAFLWFNISSENFYHHNENFYFPTFGLSTSSFFNAKGQPALPSLKMVFSDDTKQYCTNNCEIGHGTHATGDIIASYVTYSIHSSSEVPHAIPDSKLLRMVKRGNRPAFFVIDIEEPEKGSSDSPSENP